MSRSTSATYCICLRKLTPDLVGQRLSTPYLTLNCASWHFKPSFLFLLYLRSETGTYSRSGTTTLYFTLIINWAIALHFPRAYYSYTHFFLHISTVWVNGNCHICRTSNRNIFLSTLSPSLIHFDYPSAILCPS